LKKQKSPNSRAEQNKNVFGKIHEKLTMRAQTRIKERNNRADRNQKRIDDD